MAVSVTGIVAVLMVHARLGVKFGVTGSALANPFVGKLSQVLLVFTVAMATMSGVNALLITWATVLDARRSLALARALGVTPGQVSGGLAVAQMLPALAAAIIGIPAGIALYAAVAGGPLTFPVAWLAAVLAATPLVVGGLTVIPSRLAARQPVAPILQSEAA